MSVCTLIHEILKIREAQEGNRRKLLTSARAVASELESPQDIMLTSLNRYILIPTHLLTSPEEPLMPKSMPIDISSTLPSAYFRFKRC
jgi:hypothetical protein